VKAAGAKIKIKITEKINIFYAKHTFYVIRIFYVLPTARLSTILVADQLNSHILVL